MSITSAHRGPVASDVRTSLRVPADLSIVSFVRSAMACMLARVEWPAEGSARVLLASTEALTNAIEHGSPPGATVRVDLTITADRAGIVVVDQGRPGLAAVPRVPSEAPPATATRGRGLIIIDRLADEFDLRRCGEGTEVSVVFSRALDHDHPRVAATG